MTANLLCSCLFIFSDVLRGKGNDNVVGRPFLERILEDWINGIHEKIKNAQNKILLRKIKAGKWATR